MEIIIGASIGGAICGAIISYYMLKGIVEEQQQKIDTWRAIAKANKPLKVKLIGEEHRNKELEKKIESLESELSKAKSKASEFHCIANEQLGKIESLEFTLKNHKEALEASDKLIESQKERIEAKNKDIDYLLKRIEELKKKNIGLIKINYTLQQEPKPENGYTISVDERRMKVLEMRKNGLTYRDIGKNLSVSHTTAINDYKRIKEAV